MISTQGVGLKHLGSEGSEVQGTRGLRNLTGLRRVCQESGSVIF